MSDRPLILDSSILVKAIMVEQHTQEARMLLALRLSSAGSARPGSEARKRIQASNRKFQRSSIGEDSTWQPAKKGMPEEAPAASWPFPSLGPSVGAASAAAERRVAEGAFGFRFMGVLAWWKGVKKNPATFGVRGGGVWFFAC